MLGFCDRMPVTTANRMVSRTRARVSNCEKGAWFLFTLVRLQDDAGRPSGAVDQMRGHNGTTLLESHVSASEGRTRVQSGMHIQLNQFLGSYAHWSAKLCTFVSNRRLGCSVREAVGMSLARVHQTSFVTFEFTYFP